MYTDGACSGNPGPGGWAWVVPEGPYAAGAEPETTNQRMELTAALEAVGSLDGPLEVRSDSTYLVNCFRDRWWEGWIARGWKNSQRRPVANRDLWEPLVDEYRRRDIRFVWVKAHGDDPWNDLADRLAVEAAATQRSRAGERPPEVVGPADLPAGRGDRDRPEGHLLAVLGHRPPELGGYGDTPTARRLRERLSEILAAKRVMHPDLALLTGMGLGAETVAAEAALDAGVPFHAVLAFPELDHNWPEASRERFRRLLGRAAGVIELQRVVPESSQKAAGAFRRRDAWLRRNAHEAVVVWDGSDPAIGRLVRSLTDELGEEQVWLVDPASLL